MSLLRRRMTISIVAAAAMVASINLATAQIQLQTNPKLLVAYPYFSVKFVPASSAAKDDKKVQQARVEPMEPASRQALANPATDLLPFSLSEVAFYEVVTGGHSMGLMRHNLHKLML